MFTGIIETMATVESIAALGSGKIFWLTSPIAPELKVDQSVSHNGVCLTVEDILGQRFRVTAIHETLQKTTIGSWKTGDIINIERCLVINGRLDGHIVQGHVDTTAVCTERKELDGSWEFRFQLPEAFAHLIIEKGSISLNGISLTIFDITRDSFRVAIIPYTFTHTNMQSVLEGATVNIEFDMIGKYVSRLNDTGRNKN
jgi:riboflavin synthase